MDHFSLGKGGFGNAVSIEDHGVTRLELRKPELIVAKGGEHGQVDLFASAPGDFHDGQGIDFTPCGHVTGNSLTAGKKAGLDQVLCYGPTRGQYLIGAEIITLSAQMASLLVTFGHGWREDTLRNAVANVLP